MSGHAPLFFLPLRSTHSGCTKGSLHGVTMPGGAAHCGSLGGEEGPATQALRSPSPATPGEVFNAW